MPKTANRDAGQKVACLQEFKANNIFAEFNHIDNIFAEFNHIDNLYVVYSYGYHFPMYACKGGVWYKNSDKYSVTTSKHMSQACPDGWIDFKYLDTRGMKAL